MKTIDTISRAREAWELLKHLDALEAAVTEYNNAPTTMMVPENNMESLQEEKLYQFPHCIPPGWIEISREYLRDFEGREYPLITCHAPIAEIKGE